MNMLTAKLVRAMTASVALAMAPALACHAADERQSLEELRNTVVNLLQALVDQGVISREKAQQMVKAAQDKAAADAVAVAKSDEGAVRVPYVPQIVKDEIAKQVADQVKPDVVAGVVKDAKQEGWGVPGALADWLGRTRISGNVTLREEDVIYAKNNVLSFYPNYYAINQAGGFQQAGYNAFEDVNVDQVRFRGRARLGVDSSLSDSVTAGLRVVTGNTSDLVSETQTLDGTAPYAFGLDELYIRLDERNAQKFPWLSMVGGKFVNPYGTPTDLIFHKDLTFEGAAVTGRFGLGDGSAEQSHIFVTLGAHPLQAIELSTQDKYLVAGQLGANLRLTPDGQRLLLNAGFFDYFNVTGRMNPLDSPLYDYTAPQFLRQGNTYFNIINSPNSSDFLFALAAKYRLADLNLTYQLPTGPFLFMATADAVRNLAYNTAEVSANVGGYVAPRTKGYQGELSFGTPAVITRGAWRALLGYRYLQRDAVIDAYTDSDFHWGGTDAKGWYFVGDYGLANRIWMRLRYLSSNAIDGPTLGIDTLQIDLNTSF
jgi:hypothetical protein